MYGPHIEPAAFQAAKITVEEENSTMPGIHIVAELQRDRLRQISSWRLKDWIWLSRLEEAYSLLPLPLFLHVSDEEEHKRVRKGPTNLEKKVLDF